MKKTLGGDRLGSGNKMKVELHNYGRSTHNMGYIWRSTMSCGTLVPFLHMVALPGDTFDINLDCDIKTHPTVGPLFGSFKVQLDIFEGPIRLYQGALHNNKLGIGLNMANIKLPIFTLEADALDNTDLDLWDVDNLQINPSSIFAYLGLRGVGYNGAPLTVAERDFNAISWLMYWDAYKNYYANKQEEIGAVIHTPAQTLVQDVTDLWWKDELGNNNPIEQFPTTNPFTTYNGGIIQLDFSTNQPLNQVMINTSYGAIPLSEIGEVIRTEANSIYIAYDWNRYGLRQILNWYYIDIRTLPAGAIQVQTFPLSDIDNMREAILAAASTPTAFSINNSAGAPGVALTPWSYALEKTTDFIAMRQSQEGLALKTYQSDLYNNWLQTEWIDGANGINAITAIDTSGGSFTIDTLQLSRKVYDMLNRIAVSGGSYDDWMDAVYTHERYTRCESPMYHGGLIKELVFQEVVSNAESGAENQGVQPLGTLAGKGILGRKHKGGSITIKVNEPSYILGIISLTPRLDYSQGNSWDLHLKTMDDLHKPALDEIGFQELITEQFAWWDTSWDEVTQTWVQKSAGKQPAWLNYMTNVNRTLGNFAISTNEMFMTLNRRWTPAANGQNLEIDDVTTYIDPAKFNNIYAQTSLDSQNFWAQIAVDITARRKISAKIMPNL